MTRASSTGSPGSRVDPVSPGKPDQSFSLHHRLRRAVQFREAFDQGEKYAGRYMVIWLRRAPDASNKLGVIASKRSIGKAVARNRARRLLREVYRLNRYRLAAGFDVVMVARHRLTAAAWEEIVADFLTLCRKADILEMAHE